MARPKKPRFLTEKQVEAGIKRYEDRTPVNDRKFPLPTYFVRVVTDEGAFYVTGFSEEDWEKCNEV